MIQSIDLQEAVLQLWNTSTTAKTGLTITVPGGLHFGRVPEVDDRGNPTASPYASFNVKERGPERTGLVGYVQVFNVEIRVYSDKEGEPTGEISRTMDNLFDFMPTAFALNNGQTLRVMHSNRKECELKEDDARLKGTDVLQAAGRYEWLCQGIAPDF